MKLLILGGTKFLGPHLISAAQSCGHDVTTFTRGHKAAEPIDGVAAIHGDRNTDLAKLSDGRWDAVIDTCGYLPGQVAGAAEFFAGRADTYVFFSSISVYADFSIFGITEDAPVQKLSPEQISKAEAVDTSGVVSAVSFGEMYGGLKALCEQAAETAMAGRTFVIRPGLIVGPGDNTDRFTYWLARAMRGGEALAPGRPGREVQFIDVRDLAEWTISGIEQGLRGTYNANGLPGSVTIEELLDEAKAGSGSNVVFTWVSDEFMMEQGVTPWSEVPLWVPEYDSQDSRGFMFVDVSRALGTGLKLRPLSEIVQDTVQWWRSIPVRDLRAGLAPDKEREILERWKLSTAN